MFCYFMVKFLICHYQSIVFLGCHTGSGALLSNGDSHFTGKLSYFTGRLMYICMEMDFKENEAACGLFFPGPGCVSQ